MPVLNSDISEIFNRMADLLEIGGENPFKVRAYRNAARVLGGHPKSLSDMIQRGEDLTGLAGIGKDLAAKIREVVQTGSLSQLKELESRTPPELSKMMRIEGLGPRRVYTLHKELGIVDPDGLREAAIAGRIRGVLGFGEKTEKMILDYFGRERDERKERILLSEAEERGRVLVEHLRGFEGIGEISLAGSYRRRKETVGDLDILVTCRKGAKIMDHFVSFEDVARVLARGETRSTVVLRSLLQVDLRVVPQEAYGAALHYFTGSKAHNIAVRKLGVRKGIKINEYGIFKGGERVAGRTEEEVFAQVGLPFIPPELRENRGEIEAAQAGRLPRLITLKDMVGDLHVHTKETDGHHSLEELAEAARERGREYLAIADHSKRVSMAHGLDARRLAERNREIDRLNERLQGIRLLKSIEVDILKDGTLDLPDEILKEVDLTVCSIHYNRNLSRKEQTERIIRAMDNPFFNILAHPTGRLLNERDPYELDLEAVLKAARERGCFMELNASPHRLDLSDDYCRMAKEMGVRVVISTDTHRLSDLGLMRFGVDQARRGWLEPADVLNTRRWDEIKGLFKRK